MFLYLCTHTRASYLLFVSMFLKTEPKLFETISHQRVGEAHRCGEDTHGAVRGDTVGLMWATGSNTMVQCVCLCDQVN